MQSLCCVTPISSFSCPLSNPPYFPPSFFSFQSVSLHSSAQLSSFHSKQCLQFLVIYKLQNGREIEMHREMLPPSNQISLLVSRSPRSSHGGPLSLLQSIQHHSTVIGRRQDPIFDGSASRVACSAQCVTDRRHQVLMHPKHRRAVPTS